MPQLFKPAANTMVKLSLLGAAAAPLMLLFLAEPYSRSGFNTKREVALDQPVPFSHEHHADQLGIDCRYCHTSVEKSAEAGFPSTEICMSCHSQIWTNSPLLEPVRQSYQTKTPLKWARVYKLPDFAYFNHSIHVARGVSCNNCHGPVQNMPITRKENNFEMAWCLTCHRAPEKYLYRDPKSKSPRQQVFDFYFKKQRREELTARELNLRQGAEQFSDDEKDVDEGRRLVEEMGVRTQQLADCWICHR
jgi:hypothetical protein